LLIIELETDTFCRMISPSAR